MAIQHCGHPGHVNPWWSCEHCREQPRSGGFSLKGDGWTRPDDYLPPMDEVTARRSERVNKAGVKHTVETFGEH